MRHAATFSLLAILSGCASTPLLQRNHSDSQAMAIIHELRAELSDVQFALNSSKVETHILQEKVAQQEEHLRALQTQNAKPAASKTEFSSLERRLAHLEQSYEKAAFDLRSLHAHNQELTQLLNQCQQELASAHQRLDEVAKLRSTLAALSQAIQNKPSLPLPSSPRTYKVQSGDTLEKIARRHNMSVESLKKINQLRSDQIVTGQKLKLDEE